MSFPSFFLGEVPALPDLDPEGLLTPDQAFQLGYELGSQMTVEHLNAYWLERLAYHRNRTSPTYSDLTYRIDWLFDIFNGTSPNPTGETP